MHSRHARKHTHGDTEEQKKTCGVPEGSASNTRESALQGAVSTCSLVYACAVWVTVAFAQVRDEKKNPASSRGRKSQKSACVTAVFTPLLAEILPSKYEGAHACKQTLL